MGGLTLRLPLIAAAALSSLLLAGAASALVTQRDAPALFSALNDLMQFAEPGRSVRWNNPETGNSGDVTAVRKFRTGGRDCWEYERTYEDAGRIMVIEGVSCEVAPGLWETTSEGEARLQGAPKPAATAAKPSPETVTPAKPSYDRAMVRELQALLINLGYKPGPVDGAFGRRTRGALVAYQRDNDLATSGEPTDDVLARLRESVAAKAAVMPEKATTPTATSTTTGAETGSGTSSWNNPDLAPEVAPAPAPAPAASAPQDPEIPAAPPPPPPPPPPPQ